VTFGELLTIDDVTDGERYRSSQRSGPIAGGANKTGEEADAHTNRTAEALEPGGPPRHPQRHGRDPRLERDLRDHVDKEGQDALDRVLRKSTRTSSSSPRDGP